METYGINCKCKNCDKVCHNLDNNIWLHDGKGIIDNLDDINNGTELESNQVFREPIMKYDDDFFCRNCI